jgi:dynein heavy chain
VDPLDILSTPAIQATWAAEGLPADRVSTENAAVVVSCSRYPLLIDPQLQGIKWIRGREGDELVAIQLSASHWQKKVELAVSTGQTLIIDAIGQDIDAVLDPLLSRQFTKKGKTLLVKLGAEEVEVAASFKLYLQTKLINPHYKPETAAQCTIVNFIVTESGLEDQLLAMVVRVEKPELEAKKDNLTKEQQEFIIQLATLEADLLHKLVSADSDTILENVELIESLEKTKETSDQIKEKQELAKVTEKEINESRESYRPVAAEGAMLYFLLIQLWIIDLMYFYSLGSFQQFFFNAIDKTEDSEEMEVRVPALIQSIRLTIYQWVSRGLFERHKQIFLSQLTFRLMQKGILDVSYTVQQMNFLIQCPLSTATPNPLKKWLPDKAWYSIQKLIEIEGFEQFSTNLAKDAPARFQLWYNEIDPEDRPLPLEWRSLESQPFQKLLVVRCMRPDRVTTALNNFIRATLPRGGDFVDCDAALSSIGVLELAFIDSSPAIPIFFILSPGANPVKDVESLCIKEKMNPLKDLHTIALGQGQDIVAHAKLDMANKEGHWVMLQNVHLMPGFLLELEKKLAQFAVDGSDPQFRLFLTSDPSDQIPIGLLEKSIKLTNEPPAGLRANLLRAFTFFIREEFEDKDTKVKTILFSLCYFHSMMLERRKFGSKGFNMSYPFSIGDLRDSAVVAQNYLDTSAASGKIPWDDLRYIFGEIMYGGHIVDNWDRVFCNGFLQNLMNDTLLDEANMFPFTDGKAVFKCPAPTTYEKYIEYIEQELPPETPLAFGMHPNAEIDFRTTQCNSLFGMLVELQPKDAGSGEGGGDTPQSKCSEFMVRVADEAQLDQNKPNVDDILSKLSEEDRRPYQNVFI